MPNSFLYAASFDSDGLPLGLSQTNRFWYIKFANFTFKYSFGGERFVYFVDQNDDIVYFANGSSDGKEEIVLELYEPSKLPMTWQLSQELKLYPRYIKYKNRCQDEAFVPNEYYRDSISIFIVDVQRTKLMRITSNDTKFDILKFEKKIKEIVTGPLAATSYIIDEDNQLWDITGHPSPHLTTLPKDVTLKCAGVWNSGCLIVDRNNKIYINEQGGHIKSGLGYINTTADNTEAFTYIPTYLEESHYINQVKCGYYHAILKSKEGKIFVTGYDNMHQATFGTQSTTNGVDNLTECPMDYGECIQFGGFSRGEYLINTKNDVYLISEMFDGFEPKTLPHYPFAQKFNLDELSSSVNVGGLKFNDVVNTGWQCLIFHNPNKVGKHTRIREKLRQCAVECKLTDLSFNFLDEL